MHTVSGNRSRHALKSGCVKLLAVKVEDNYGMANGQMLYLQRFAGWLSSGIGKKES